MKLAKLLELDSPTTNPHVLKDVFGDAFLLAQNPVYQRVRELGVKAGVKYRAGLTANDIALPLARLEIYIQEKTLPYTPTRPALMELPPRVSQTTEWPQVADALKKNFLMHETAHVLFREAWPAKDNSTEAKVLRVLCEESFVNSVEMMGLHFADDNAHRAFYEANSYFFVADARVPLKNAIQDLGLSYVLAFAMLTYLRVNAFQEDFRDQDIDRMLKIAGDLTAPTSVSPQTRKALRALIKICADLNPAFRENTTGFHFRLLGLEQPLEQLLNFNVLNAFASHAPQPLRSLIASFA